MPRRWPGPLPPRGRDAKILRGTPRRKVRLTWVPWTHERLASSTGYGAGIASPGWYHHLWTAPDRPIARWLTRVARALRARDLLVSSAHVIEAVRLAETLAGLRGRPLAGLAEVTEATRAVLCDGDELAVRYRHRPPGRRPGPRLGQRRRADRAAGGRPGRDLPDAADPATRRSPRIHDLDLRRSIDQAPVPAVPPAPAARAGLGHARPRATVQGQGTFRETWAVALASRSTPSRWSRRRCGAPRSSPRPPNGSSAGSPSRHACRADRAGRTLPARRPARGARPAAAPRSPTGPRCDADVVHLMDALPPLARAQRYGDVRGTDTSALRQVAEVLVVRICAGLPRAVAGLDEDSAGVMRRRIDGSAAPRTADRGRVDDRRRAGARRRPARSAVARPPWRALVDRTDLHGRAARADGPAAAAMPSC